jgi:replication factor A1
MQNTRRKRGRPRNKFGLAYSSEVCKALDYLAKIVLRININSDMFFNALVDAWKQNESTCQKLTIRCRKRKQDSVIFLFTIGEKVLGQFSVPKLILQKENPLKEYMDTLPPEIFLRKKSKAKNPKIEDLEQRMKNVNLKARVLETPKPRLVYTRIGTQAFVSNILLADETGTIKLALWNQNIKKVSVDDIVKLENVNVTGFRGECQLRLKRNSALTVLEGEEFPSADYLEKPRFHE